MYSRIAGTGSYLPEQVVTNFDLANGLFTIFGSNGCVFAETATHGTVVKIEIVIVSSINQSIR